jgi:putative colanic acid biosynthesis acetyltransferase WcaF
MKYQELSEFQLPRQFRGRSAFIVQLWWIIQSTIFRCSPQFAYKWRVFLLRVFGARIGKNVIIRPSVKITYPWKLTIRDSAWVGDYVDLYTLGKITIGRNAVVSQKSYLCTGSHDYQSEAFDIFAKPIVIEDEVWVATDVFIAPGVTIGKGTVIGSRSSVYKDMPEGMICIGNPAKPIKSRIDNETNTTKS